MFQVTIAPTSERHDEEGDPSEAVHYFVRSLSEADDLKSDLLIQEADGLGLYWRVISIAHVHPMDVDDIIKRVRY